MVKRGGSVTNRLIAQSQDSALAGVQVFNSSLMRFKSESFIVLMNIAWTYLLHAYYRRGHVEYRYFSKGNQRRRFERTSDGSYRYWSLRDCINAQECPLDGETVMNIRFLIGLRDEITHHMSPILDQYVSARYQACCLNFNTYLIRLFGPGYAIDRHLQFSLQLQRITREQMITPDESDLPANVRSFIARFDKGLTDAELNSERFAYRMLFVPKLVGKRGQADEVIEFFKADSSVAEAINKEYLAFKEVERPKYRPGTIVKMMREEGYRHFTMGVHTDLWKTESARDPSCGFGTLVEGSWFWYESWVQHVREYCIRRADELS
jgi:hypothetical protein